MARNRRNEECCSVYLLRTVLYILNLIFLIAGLGVLGVGAWIVTDKYKYVELLTTVTYPVITYFLVVAGGLILFITILGCCAIWWNNRLCLVFYIFLLLLVFLIEVMVGVIAYIYEEQVQHELELQLNNTFLSSYKIETDKTEAIDFLQEKFHCCGALSFEDWEYSTWRKQNLSGSNLVPDSCCKTISTGCGIVIRPSNINYNSCLIKMSDHMRNHLFVLSVVASGISVFQVLGIVLSCQLYFKLRNYIDDL
ncbi:hypothetical protein RN001_003157 [Aquatica leii]|uniref:Tetraspanin n=1 Tax=Aquatica leii TaxID=1421715 RepID=A0AAN7PNA8_9COLE|nr:hypothetical protein RN001_003157 [Aquatica leii]